MKKVNISSARKLHTKYHLKRNQYGLYKLRMLRGPGAHLVHHHQNLNQLFTLRNRKVVVLHRKADVLTHMLDFLLPALIVLPMYYPRTRSRSRPVVTCVACKLNGHTAEQCRIRLDSIGRPLFDLKTYCTYRHRRGHSLQECRIYVSKPLEEGERHH